MWPWDGSALHEMKSEFPEAVHETKSELAGETRHGLHEVRSESRKRLHESKSELAQPETVLLDKGFSGGREAAGFRIVKANVPR